eukprot:3694981-Rhodomonas_salina.1
MSGTESAYAPTRLGRPALVTCRGCLFVCYKQPFRCNDFQTSGGFSQGARACGPHPRAPAGSAPTYVRDASVYGSSASVYGRTLSVYARASVYGSAVSSTLGSARCLDNVGGVTSTLELAGCSTMMPSTRHVTHIRHLRFAPLTRAAAQGVLGEKLAVELEAKNKTDDSVEWKHSPRRASSSRGFARPRYAPRLCSYAMILRYAPTSPIYAVRYWPCVWSYAVDTRCPGLTSPYAGVSGAGAPALFPPPRYQPPICYAPPCPICLTPDTLFPTPPIP